MTENRYERLLRAGRKAGMTEETAEIFAKAVAKELDLERGITTDAFKDVRNEMKLMEQRLIIWGGGALALGVILVTGFSALIALLK